MEVSAADFMRAGVPVTLATLVLAVLLLSLLVPA